MFKTEKKKLGVVRLCVLCVSVANFFLNFDLSFSISIFDFYILAALEYRQTRNPPVDKPVTLN